jgi:hypothetical protein
MTTAATRRPAPAKRTEDVSLPELTAGERLAADLRVLADLAASTTPPVADDLATTFQEVTVVLRVNGGGQDVLAAALAKHAAAEQPARRADDAGLFDSERSWLLPNRAIRLSAWSLDVSVDDIEAAGR